MILDSFRVINRRHEEEGRKNGSERRPHYRAHRVEIYERISTSHDAGPINRRTEQLENDRAPPFIYKRGLRLIAALPRRNRKERENISNIPSPLPPPKKIGSKRSGGWIIDSPILISCSGTDVMMERYRGKGDGAKRA